MKALGYNPHVTIQIALAGNAADLIKHHDRAAQRGEQLRLVKRLAGQMSRQMCEVHSPAIHQTEHDCSHSLQSGLA